jgi:hypothetical protein
VLVGCYLLALFYSIGAVAPRLFAYSLYSEDVGLGKDAYWKVKAGQGLNGEASFIFELFN